MTALAKAKEVVSRKGDILLAKMAADTIIYKGGHVMLEGGYATPSAATNALIGLGMALETIDNSGGDAAAKEIRVDFTEIVKLDGFTGLAITDVGTDVYASDDQTFTTTASNNIPVGKIVELVSATVAWVKPVLGGVAATV